jgi:hypothetical protein
MALVRSANPIWYFVDLNGVQLDDTFYLFILANVFPYVPIPIYQDADGVTPWSDPIQFLPNGTLPQNMYFNPDITYLLQIRQGPTTASPLVYSIPDYIPNGNGGGGNVTVNPVASNQIVNPDFSQILFNSPLVITSAGTYNIAPGWQYVVTGTGSTTLTQIISVADAATATNPVPAYALEINATGWTTSILQQVFNGLGAIYANDYLAMSVNVLSNTSGMSYPVTLVYSPQSPGTPVTIGSGTAISSSYTMIQGVQLLPQSTNTNLNNVSFVDMQVVLPGTSNIIISNVQVVEESSPLPVSYNQQSVEQQVNQTFFYYANELIIKPKQSILTGWNFSLNPYQFITTTVSTVTAQTSYVADCTILHQEGASLLQTGKNATVGNRGTFYITPVAGASQTATRFALIQYIDPVTIRPYWSYYVSSLVRSLLFSSVGSKIRLKMRLIYQAGLPPDISATEPIASWPSNSDPTFASGWTAIAPLNDPAYYLSTLNEGTGDAFPYYTFDQFFLPVPTSSAQTLGIVLYTMDNMSSITGSVDAIGFDRVSLVPNKFAVDSPPETFDESLRKCQFYWEQSYPVGTIAGGTNSFGGAVFSRLPTFIGVNPNVSSSFVGFNYYGDLNVRFQQAKRANPVMTFYSPVTGNAAVLSAGIYAGNTYTGVTSGSNPTDVNISNWQSIAISKNSALYHPNNVNPISQISGSVPQEAFGELLYHYTADARLGVN